MIKSGDDGNRTRTNRSTICRAEPLTLRHRVVFRVAQVGLEPTASLSLSQGGLPIAYRAVLLVSTQSRIRTCKHPGLIRTALPLGVSGPDQVVPDGVEPSFPGCDPSVVAVGPRDRVFEWTHPDLHRGFRRAEPASSYWTMSPFCRPRFTSVTFRQGMPPRT